VRHYGLHAISSSLRYLNQKRRQVAALVRLKAQVVGEVEVLFRQTLSGL
jgi:hypothetical protein